MIISFHEGIILLISENIPAQSGHSARAPIVVALVVGVEVVVVVVVVAKPHKMALLAPLPSIFFHHHFRFSCIGITNCRGCIL